MCVSMQHVPASLVRDIHIEPDKRSLPCSACSINTNPLAGYYCASCSGASAAAAAAASNGQLHTSEGAGAAEEEVVAERLLRELTAEHFALLIALQDEGVSSAPQCLPLPALLAVLQGGLLMRCCQMPSSICWSMPGTGLCAYC